MVEVPRQQKVENAVAGHEDQAPLEAERVVGERTAGQVIPLQALLLLLVVSGVLRGKAKRRWAEQAGKGFEAIVGDVLVDEQNHVREETREEEDSGPGRAQIRTREEDAQEEAEPDAGDSKDEDVQPDDGDVAVL